MSHPLAPLMSGLANDLGGSEGVEAVLKGDTELDFCGLAFRGMERTVSGQPRTD